MKYSSPIHIMETDDRAFYFNMLSGFIDQLVIEYNRHTYTMAEQWPIVRAQVAKYKALRQQLFKLHSFQEIEDELNFHRYDICNAPVVSCPKGQAVFSDLRIFNRTWCHINSFRPMEMPLPDLTGFVEEGWGWDLRIGVTVPNSSSPRFSINRLAQSLNSYGIFVQHAAFNRSENGLPVYRYQAFMPANIWRNLAMMEKLAGNIEGQIEFLDVLPG